MAVLHIVECPTGHSFMSAVPDGTFSVPCLQCPDPPLQAEIVWQPSYAHDSTVHPSERAVIWRHPVTGHVEYPMRNDIPMPKRYAAWGYQRVEADTLRSLHNIERQSGTRNERAWFDKGSGRNFDGADCG